MNIKSFYEEDTIRRIDKCILFLAALSIILIPIITRKHQGIFYSPILANNSFKSGAYAEIFNYYKTAILYFLTIIILGLFIYKIYSLKYEIQKNPINIGTAIFSIAIVLSSLFADYKGIALFGNNSLYEGSLAWICYLGIFFVLYNIKIEKKYESLLYYSLLPFLLVNAILGIIHLYGYNILDVKFIANIISDTQLGGYLSTTLYNPNFSSGLGGMVFAMSFTKLLLDDNLKSRLFSIFYGMLAFIIVMASLSNSGFLVILSTLPIVILLALKYSDRKNVLTWSLINILLNSVILFSCIRLNSRVYDETIAIFVKVFEISPLIYPIAIVLFIGAIFIINKIKNKKGLLMILTLSVIGMTLIFLVCSKLYFTKLDKELENKPKYEVTKIRDTGILKKLDELTSYRVTIWEETMSLINKKPILGNGFNTLPYTLNHNEQEGIYYNMNIDKPHSIYLTVLYGSGIVGFLGFLLIILYILNNSLCLIIDKNKDKMLYVCLIGIVAFLLQGILNDTLSGTAIVFWVFSGLCANRLIYLNNEDVK